MELFRASCQQNSIVKAHHRDCSTSVNIMLFEKSRESRPRFKPVGLDRYWPSLYDVFLFHLLIPALHCKRPAGISPMLSRP